MRLKKILGYLGSIMFIPLIAGANTDTTCTSNGWCYTTPFPKIFSVNDVCEVNEHTYVAGVQGSIAHFDGTDWSVIQTDTKENIEGLYCASNQDIYATGTNILIHYDGKRWENIKSDSIKNGYWHRVWANNGKIVLAGFEEVAYFNGEHWTHPKTGLVYGESIESLWGNDIEHLYAVGGKNSDAGGFILQFDGKDWQNVYKLNTYHFLDIFGFSNEDIYVIGTDDMNFGEKGIVVHYDGEKWQPYKINDMNTSAIPELGTLWGNKKMLFIAGGKHSVFELKRNALKTLNFPYKIPEKLDTVKAIWSDAAGKLYLAADNDDYNRDNVLLFRFDTKHWELLNPVFHDLYMPSSDIAFAVGQYGAIWKHTSTSWEKMSSDSIEDLRGLWGTSVNNVYAVGLNNTLLHFDGKVWKKDTSLQVLENDDEGFYGIWGSAENDIYVISEKAIYHYDGKVWKNMEIDTKGKSLSAIHGRSKNDFYVLAGSDFVGGTVLHYNGKEWNSLPMPAKKYFSFKKIFATKDGGLFAISTSDNVLYSYVHGVWKKTVYSSKNSTDKIYLQGLWGNSKQDMYVVGGMILGDSFVIHFDGMNWQDIDTFPNATSLCLAGYGGELKIIAGANGWNAIKNRTSLKTEEKERLGKEGKYEKTQLHKAVAENNLELVKKILNRGVEIDVVDKLGRTPLHYAAFRGYVDIAKLLLEKGADINAVEKSRQWTPLFFAVFMHHEEMIKLLIGKGADKTIKDRLGKTADEYK